MPSPLPNTQTPSAHTDTPKVISQLTKLDAPDVTTTLAPGEAAVLKAAFQYGEQGAPLAAVALMTGYKSRSITNFITALRAHPSGPLIERAGAGITITPAGVALVPTGTKPYPKGRALIKHLIDTLPDGESKVLGMALNAHPQAVSVQELASELPYKPRSITNFIVHLVSRRAIERAGKGLIKIHHQVMR